MAKGNRTGRGTMKKGETRNPNGRPKGLSITDLLRSKLNEPVLDTDGNPTGRTYKDVAVAQIIEHALKKKDFRVLQYMVDRVDGKAVESIKQETTISQADMRIVFENTVYPDTSKIEVLTDTSKTEVLTNTSKTEVL